MRMKEARGPSFSLLGALLGVCLALASCRDEMPKPPQREVTPIDPETAATISGTVLFQGPVPPQAEVRLGGWAECTAQHEGPVHAGDVLVEGGKLRNAIVYVKEGLGDRVFAIPEEPVVVDQKGCVFVPRIAAARAYQPVQFLNGDPMAHNVHGLARKSQEWNFSLGVKGAARTIALASPEVPIEIVCDIHPWMRAYIAVFDHPYFALSAADGSFALGNLPPGQYVVEAWHERFGTRATPVSLGARDRAEISFTFSASKPAR